MEDEKIIFALDLLGKRIDSLSNNIKCLNHILKMDSQETKEACISTVSKSPDIPTRKVVIDNIDLGNVMWGLDKND